MPGTTGVAIPIQSLRVVGSIGAQAPIRRIIEKAGQTFLQGTPTQIDTTTGSIQACPAITSVATAVIFGFSTESASNLATTGVPQVLQQNGNPPNQPNAVFIPVGAWPNDGTVGNLQALPEQVLAGLIGNSVDNTLALVAATDIGKIFGLTKDSNGYWFIDKNITTTAAGACVQITDLMSPVGTLNGREGFVVTAAAQQMY